MRKEPIVTGEYYHVFSRGTDRRSTYDDDTDHERFVLGMIVFNDISKKSKRLRGLRTRPSRSKHPLVRILCYALMPNHYHFLVQQLVDNGIACFMHQLGTGYVSYFNRRYQRSGCLWESEYKAVRIESDAQLLHISRYIHLNPLKLAFPRWKLRGVPSWTVAHAALIAYPWSSYRHFLGVERDSIVDMDILADMFRGPEDYKLFIQTWVATFAEAEPR